MSQRGAGQYITQLDTRGRLGCSADILWCVGVKITAPLPKGKTFSRKILHFLPIRGLECNGTSEYFEYFRALREPETSRALSSTCSLPRATLSDRFIFKLGLILQEKLGSLCQSSDRLVDEHSSFLPYEVERILAKFSSSLYFTALNSYVKLKQNI